MKYPITDVTLSSLVVDPKNPNKMSDEDYRALVAAIDAAGFLQPILVKDLGDGTYGIVDGHHRSRAAAELGYTDVPAVIWDGSEEMRIAVQLGMNRNRGDLDLSLAAQRVLELANAGWSSEQMVITGFTEREIASLLDAAQPKDLDDVLDDVGNLDIALDDEDDRPIRPFVLELSFAHADDLKKVRKVLRRAAGKGGELGDALLKLLAQKE